jgi:predicted MFS family arabinose efflux permease
MADDIQSELQQSTELGINSGSPSEPNSTQTTRPKIKAFSAFAYRNYQLWFTGQLASLVGTWMQTTAQGHLVYDLTHSPAYLGYVGFALGIPMLVFTVFGGVVADRMSKRDMLIVTEVAMMALAFILAALTFTGLIQPWHILILAFLLGTANAFDAPARQALPAQMVNRDHLSNAIALTATMNNLGVFFGPAVGGIVYALFGPAWCFTINGISFIAVI